LPSVSSVDEAAAALREASTAQRPVRIGRDLRLDGLDRVLAHEAGDLTCTVEAGIRLSRLNEQLARAGQRLSLDPPGDPTIGACLAAALSGPRRHRFGTPRDLVLGVTLVLGDGSVASAGGTVVKNVAGYDLGKLVCGSRGRLALIARVSLRLHPVPVAARTVVVETDDCASVVAALRRSQLVPSALDVLHPGRVAVLFEGGEAAVAAQLASTLALVGGAEADDDVWEESRERQAEAQGIVRFRPGDLAARLADLGPGALVRAGPGVAYTPSNTVLQSPPPPLAALHERIRAALDPAGILA
jgi:glycolate oxidase FAD binding subunit